MKLPHTIKAAIINFDQAAQLYALKGSHEPDITDLIEEDYQAALQDLESQIIRALEMKPFA